MIDNSGSTAAIGMAPPNMMMTSDEEYSGNKQLQHLSVQDLG